MTAMLDIIFMLLVFFILTSGTAFRSLDLTLPRSAEPRLQATATAKTVVLGVGVERFFLDDEEFTEFSQLESALSARLSSDKDAHVVVAADKGVPIQRFLDVLSELKTKGIAIASVLMKAKERR